jgi:hypothetical protein
MATEITHDDLTVSMQDDSLDSISWDEQVTLENEKRLLKEKNGQNSNSVASSSKTRLEKQNNKENKTTTSHIEQNNTSFAKTNATSINKNKEVSSKSWSSLFAKVKRGQSTFSSFSPRNNIRSKNDNALILDIHNLNGSLNEIMISLYETAGRDIIAAKPHVNRGSRTHLELIFTNEEKLKYYATKGVEIYNRTYYGHIPVDSRRSFLPVKIRNVPLGDKEFISERIKNVFENFGKIASIKPLLIEATSYLTDQ